MRKEAIASYHAVGYGIKHLLVKQQLGLRYDSKIIRIAAHHFFIWTEPDIFSDVIVTLLFYGKMASVGGR